MKYKKMPDGESISGHHFALALSEHKQSECELSTTRQNVSSASVPR